MKQEDQFEIGQLTAEVGNLKNAIDRLWRTVNLLQTEFTVISKVVSKGKGFFAGMCFMAMLLGSLLTFLLTKGAKLIGIH